jgi:hypothetical protein
MKHAQTGALVTAQVQSHQSGECTQDQKQPQSNGFGHVREFADVAAGYAACALVGSFPFIVRGHTGTSKSPTSSFPSEVAITLQVRLERALKGYSAGLTVVSPGREALAAWDDNRLVSAAIHDPACDCVSCAL